MSWTGVITNAGQDLLDQWAQGSHTLTIDRAAVGSGLTAAADMFTATNLANQQDTAAIISKEAITGGTKFKILISPASNTAYTAREVGLWAHIDNGSSVLMSLHQDEAGGISIPTQAQSPDFAFAMYIIHAISNTEEIEVNIDPNAYVPLSTFNAEVTARTDADTTLQTSITSLGNTKLDKTGASTSNTVTFTSGDAADGSVTRTTGWTSVTQLASGLTHANLFARISQMMKNVRWLYKMLGTTDISSLSDAGTVTAALSKLNTDLTYVDEFATINYGSSSYVKYAKVGRMVIVYGTYFVSDGVISSWATKDIGIIPAGYCPVAERCVTTCQTDRATSAGCFVEITTAGTVKIAMRYASATDTSDVLAFYMTYPIV